MRKLLPLAIVLAFGVAACQQEAEPVEEATVVEETMPVEEAPAPEAAPVDSAAVPAEAPAQ